MLRIGIVGYYGRMGREIATACRSRGQSFELIGGVVRRVDPSQPVPANQRVVTKPEDILPFVDVLLDFSKPEFTEAIATGCAKTGTPLVNGVTGLSGVQHQYLHDAGSQFPVFYASNMSVGIALMAELVESLASRLPEADIEILERHHRRKVDAPSGTAMTLLERAESGREHPGRRVMGREGESLRIPGEIGVSAIRGGGNPGEHQVSFLTDGEEFTISHRALSRRTFADGALDAAGWLVNQQPGFYGMADYLAANSG